jgi:hypothetical protein
MLSLWKNRQLAIWYDISETLRFKRSLKTAPSLNIPQMKLDLKPKTINVF